MAREFGVLFRRFREEAGLSLGAVANSLRVSTPYLSDVERGNRTPLTNKRIAAAAALLGLAEGKFEELLAAAAASRGYFELSANQTSPQKRELGAALARGWTDLGDEKARRLLEVLNQEDQ